jgi:hypothetical protein
MSSFVFGFGIDCPIDLVYDTGGAHLANLSHGTASQFPPVPGGWTDIAIGNNFLTDLGVKEVS